MYTNIIDYSFNKIFNKSKIKKPIFLRIYT